MYKDQGSTRLTASSIKATTRSYRDAVIAGGTTTLKADENGAGTVRFSQSVNGTSNGSGSLIVNATTTEFVGPVGSTANLGGLTTDSIGTTIIRGGNIGATSETFNDPITIAADTTFAGTSVSFNSTLDADTAANNRNVEFNASGSTLFADSVGSIAKPFSLETDSSGLVVFGSGAMVSPAIQVLTTGAQTYRDAATVRSDNPGVILGGSSIEFHGCRRH